MKTSVFSKLLEKAVEASKTGAELIIRFKARKRKKFLKTAMKDIKRYYKASNMETVTADLQEDNATLDSQAFVVTQAEKITRSYEGKVDESVKDIVKKMNVWDITSELMCEQALYNAFGRGVFGSDEIFNNFTALHSKVNSLLVKTKKRLSLKGCGSYFDELYNEILANVSNYKLLIEALK